MWPNWSSGQGTKRLRTQAAGLLTLSSQSFRWLQMFKNRILLPYLFHIWLLVFSGNSVATSSQIRRRRHWNLRHVSQSLLDSNWRKLFQGQVIILPCRCDKLRVSQIIKILNLYTPAGWITCILICDQVPHSLFSDEFEERVSPAFVRKIQGRLQVNS